MNSLQFALVGGQECFESLHVDPAVRVQGADGALKSAHLLLAVVHLDFGNEPIQAQPDRRVGNAVGLRQFLERARRQHKTLQERQILIFEQLHPSMLVAHLNIIKLDINKSQVGLKAYLLFSEGEGPIVHHGPVPVRRHKQLLRRHLDRWGQAHSAPKNGARFQAADRTVDESVAWALTAHDAEDCVDRTKMSSPAARARYAQMYAP